MTENIKSQFSELEQSEIVKAMNQMPVLSEGESANFNLFVSWVEGWFGFTGFVQNGYPASIYDYWNDMDGRLNLTRLASLVSESTASKIEQLIVSADNQYFDATVPLIKPQSDVFGYGRYPDKWLRKPKKLIGMLKDDYDKRGIE